MVFINPALSPSSSSSSLAMPLDSPTTHLAKLEKKQRDLLQVQEITTLVPKFETSPERITSKLLELQERYVYAQGDASDGRWGHISDLLRVNCTRHKRDGRYCLNRTPPDAKIPIPPSQENPFILAETEEEWVEWEKKRGEEVKVQLKLRRKVSRWQEEVAKASKLEKAKDKGKAKVTRENVKESEPRSQSQSQSQSQPTLGFKVVKASSSKKLVAKPSNPQLGDVTQSTFSPPSFRASQVITSTPNPQERNKHRPKIPIIERAEPLSPLPEEPPYPFLSQPGPVASQGLKRSHPEDELEQAPSKKGKLTEPSSKWPPCSGPGKTTPPASIDDTPNKAKPPFAPLTPLPSTPKRDRPLPTLTEILSSRPKHSVTSTPRKQFQIRLDGPPSPHFTDHEEPLKDETEVRQLVAGVPSSPAVSVRSFSMLADSDSSSDSSHHGSPPESPCQGHRSLEATDVAKSKSLGDNFGVYSSQFDVEGYVGGVQELLSKDDIMFDMYIKDPDDD